MVRFAAAIVQMEHPRTECKRLAAQVKSHKSLKQQERSLSCQRRFAANRRRRLSLRLHRDYVRSMKHGEALARRVSLERCAANLIRRAADRNLCTLKPSDLLPLPSSCPCCGNAMTYRNGVKHAYSIDRRDNLEGYWPGNVVVVCYTCNIIKGAWTRAQLQAVVDCDDMWPTN